LTGAERGACTEADSTTKIIWLSVLCLSKAHVLPSAQGKLLKAFCHPEVGRRWVFCFTYNSRDFEIQIDMEPQ